MGRFSVNSLMVLCSVILLSIRISAQETFPENGVKTHDDNFIAFTNATIIPDPSQVIQNGTLLIRKNEIIAVGASVSLPKNTVVYDMKGKYIYASFIDLHSTYGIEQPKKKKGGGPKKPQFVSNKPGAGSWNEAIHPETNNAQHFKVDPKAAKELLAAGFGAVVTHRHDGIMRGASCLVHLGDERGNKMVIVPEVANNLAFKKGTTRQNYPSSLMGAIALIRQTYLDAEWYDKYPKNVERNVALDAVIQRSPLPQIFDPGRSYLSALRADRLGDEFGIQYVLIGSGEEYKRIDDIKNSGAGFVVPITYPKPYNVEDPYEAKLVQMKDLKHWELAPSNLHYLQTASIPFAITFNGHKKAVGFHKHLASSRDIRSRDILAALTTSPAQLINQSDKLGSLVPRKIANFIITRDTLLGKKFKVEQSWVNGKRYAIEVPEEIDLAGKYDLNIEDHIYELTVRSEPKLKAWLRPKNSRDTTKIKAILKQDGRLISLAFDPNDKHYKGYVRLSGSVHFNSGILEGKGEIPGGKWTKWSAIKNRQKVPKEKKKEKETTPGVIGKVWFPNMAYGFDTMPEELNIIYRNATLWTCEEQGKIKGDIWIRNGKIYKIGQGLGAVEGVTVVDAKGKHITPGIIDEHSHIAISSGVNEGTQAVTAEVRIGDVVDSDDIDIYRQLAGGVTTSQLLHGSANPIGGQSALVKLRWGQAPEKMKIENAPGFIKFALGENVKQSNWGPQNTIRFPQTRMGVEQVFYDAFNRARIYEKQWNSYNLLKPKKREEIAPPRRDLELDALFEILNKERFITCHSYIQSEITMLMRVGDSLGFTINTFTHILEGYKIADKMKKHGAAGSSFSDWWAYKFEVNDAIPHNAAMLDKMGIPTAINSDDAEMGRRLNQEAAKAVKYGGASEEAALNMVTINPAKILHLDDRIGSLKEGKDADIVIWDNHPLSIYSKVEQTLIDGKCYYSRDQNERLIKAMEAERSRIIQKMIEAKKNGAATQPVKYEEPKHYHCDTIDEEY